MIGEFCLFFTAYTHDKILRMPYVTFVAMLEFIQQKNLQANMEMKKLQQLQQQKIPKWPKKRK